MIIRIAKPASQIKNVASIALSGVIRLTTKPIKERLPRLQISGQNDRSGKTDILSRDFGNKWLRGGLGNNQRFRMPQRLRSWIEFCGCLEKQTLRNLFLNAEPWVKMANKPPGHPSAAAQKSLIQPALQFRRLMNSDSRAIKTQFSPPVDQ